MEPQDRQESQNARVVALGGLLAGVAGSLYVLLSERERKPRTKVERARQSLEEAATQAREHALALESGLAHELKDVRARSAKTSRRARMDGSKLGMRARKQTKREAEEARERMAAMMLSAKEKGSKRLQGLEKQVPDVAALAQEFLGRTESSLGKAKESGSKSAKKAREEAGRAQQDIKHLVVRAREEAPKRLHEVETVVAPKVKDLEKQAADMLELSKERAADLRKRAEKDLLPEVRDTAEKVRSRVEDQAKVAATRLEHGSAEAVHRLTDATDLVETRAKDASSAVAQGGRDLRSLIVWLALGGALVYAAFLNDEQRQKVRAWANRLMDEASATYGDIKGQDGTFGAA